MKITFDRNERTGDILSIQKGPIVSALRFDSVDLKKDYFALALRRVLTHEKRRIEGLQEVRRGSCRAER